VGAQGELFKSQLWQHMEIHWNSCVGSAFSKLATISSTNEERITFAAEVQ
jgi:hypothetical protein